MPRKPVQKPAESKSTTSAQVVKQELSKVVQKQPELQEQTYTSDDRYSCNELVIQNVPSKRDASDRQWRVFVRPEEADEPDPDEVWSAHESEEQTAIDTLFKTYANGVETTRLEIVKGDDEFVVNVWKATPKKEDECPDMDAGLPSVYFDIDDLPSGAPGRTIGSLHAVLAGSKQTALRDEYDDTSNAIPKNVHIDDPGELFGFIGELAELVQHERLAGDPGRSYPLDTRLREIFATMKRGTK
jgi:hypothetical protein